MITVKTFLWLFLLIPMITLAQSNSGTGRTVIKEEDFNAQLEKCKVDTNATPSVNTNQTTTSPSNSSKGKAQ